MDRSTLRVAVRTLGRHKGFTTVAILSLAVAIALNTVMYSVLETLIAPNISAREPDHLYLFWYYGNFRGQLAEATIENALKTGTSGNVIGLTGSIVYRPGLGFFGEPLAENGPRYKRIQPRIVRPNYFEFLGTAPLDGRTFRPGDATEGQAVAVISDRLAKTLFPNESPIGRSMTLDGNGFTVIGVVPRQTFPLLSSDMYLLPQNSSVTVPIRYLRLRDKIDPVALDQMFKLAAARLAMAADEKTAWTAFRGRAIMAESFRPNPFHWALFGAVAAVLLVACANLANLQLARGLARSRELALRAAVGASRNQLIRLLVLESGILAGAGLLLGITLTFWGIHLINAWIPDVMEFRSTFVSPQVSWGMFVFAAIAALLCLFLVGLVPALHISRVDPNELLKSGAGTGANRHHRRRYGFMVTAQIGLALPVLIAAIIVLKTSVQLRSLRYLLDRYGYDPTPIARATVPFYKTGRVMAADIAADLSERAKRVPGVVDVAASFSSQPGRNELHVPVVTVDGKLGDLREEMAPQWTYRVVTPTYRQTYGRPLDAGRDFDKGDLTSNVVMVDGPTARFLWPREDPVGRSIKFGGKFSDLPWYRVIGVVGDQRDTAMIRRYTADANYRLFGVFRLMQAKDSLAVSKNGFGSLELVVRLDGNAELGAVRIQRQLHGFRTDRPVNVIPEVDQLFLKDFVQRSDFVGSLFSVFAFLGLALVAIGVFGIVSHSVEERRREFAVRISFGATARDIIRAAIREGNVLILAGTAIGLFFTKYTIFWLGGFFFEDDGYNAPFMAVIAAGLFAVAVISAFIPALRATRIDPVDALRHE